MWDRVGKWVNIDKKVPPFSERLELAAATEAVLYQPHQNCVQTIRTDPKTLLLSHNSPAFPMITKASYVFYAALPPWPHNRIMNNFYKFTKTNHMARLKSLLIISP